jgi:hypothetical protein
VRYVPHALVDIFAELKPYFSKAANEVHRYILISARKEGRR